ncbi:MAG: hypothetical protein AB1416_09435 [Actinomycetota bacterium]
MIDAAGLELRALERRLERAISDYLAVSRGSGLFAHAAAGDQAEHEAWERMMAARDDLDAARARLDTEAAAAGA